MDCRSDYSYFLPLEQIAQRPASNRSDSRLLLLDRRSGALRHDRFWRLGSHLRRGDLLVCNDTRVVAARLRGRKGSTGGAVEALFERRLDTRRALFQLRCSKKPAPGSALLFQRGEQEIQARVVDRLDEFYVLEFPSPVEEILQRFGETPLPPYIKRAPDCGDAERYQSLYARRPGSVAAPTASLHFDKALLTQLAALGVSQTFLTLHVGAGTFQPVREEQLSAHKLHSEWCEINNQTVEQVAEARRSGGRVIAVGTTVVRALEAAATRSGYLAPYCGKVDMFIRPPHDFRVIDGMITNFHLPESTLLMLVCAFAGLEETMTAYRSAVQAGYRFFSYGDAMLILSDSD